MVSADPVAVAADPAGSVAGPSQGPPTQGPSTERRKPGLIFWLSTAWIMMLVFFAIFVDLLPIRDPETQGIITREVASFESPGSNAWFGADSNGRDLFSNVVHGVRPALILGITVTVIAAVIGSAIGILAGYVRGKTDAIIMTLVDTAFAFPAIVALIAVRASFGNGILVFVMVFSILGLPAYTRIVRGATMALAEREFVEAARAMGASRARIMLRELAPNIALPVLSFAFLGFAIVIGAEGGLAFIGLSLDQTTWGKLIAQGLAQIREHSFLTLIPATAMFLTILAFNFVGDTIRRLAAPQEVATARKPTAMELPVDSAPAAAGALLTVRSLHTQLGTPGGVVHAVDGVSLEVAPGEALGVVGESGSGKTMILRSILGTFPTSNVTRSGQVLLGDLDLLRCDDQTRRTALGTRIGTISQNPLTALNPVRRIGTQIMEPMRVHRGVDKRAAEARALELLEQVGIPDPRKRLREYPHQLSGGMRQRVTIAIALANEPDLLLADEPTTALDVTVQDQIMRLLSDLRSESGMAMMLVTHDLAVVRGFTDRVAIVYGGQIVEVGPTEEIFANPQHQYTIALMRSIPDLTLPSHSELAVIDGRPPSLIEPPRGCRFAARCPVAQERCRSEAPGLDAAQTTGHAFACWFPSEQSIEGR